MKLSMGVRHQGARTIGGVDSRTGWKAQNLRASARLGVGRVAAGAAEAIRGSGAPIWTQATKSAI